MAQNEARGFRRILGSIIACTSLERIAYLPGKVSRKVTKDIAVWCSKPWEIMIFGVGTHFFGMMGSH
jgi:hypothetical protein